MVGEDHALRLRGKAAKCRDLANSATDADVASALRQIAADIEAAITILGDR